MQFYCLNDEGSYCVDTCKFQQQRREEKLVRSSFGISFLVEIHRGKYMDSKIFSERCVLG